MSTTVRSSEAQARGMPLAPRAVRVRNVCLRAIANKRGLTEPTDSDLAQLQSDVTLSAAVRWWDQVQRPKGAAPADMHAAASASERSNLAIKVAAISAVVLLALLAFPREVAGHVETDMAINDHRPAGKYLEKLRGKRAGQYSNRVNDQWRVCFRWSEGNAHDVEIVDYH